MPDLGAIARSESIDALIRPVPWQGGRSTPANLVDLQAMLTEDVQGTISGVVQINGVNQAGVKVALLHRTGMNLIALAVTNGSGAYSFPQLDRNDLKNYLVVMLDPQQDPTYNYTIARDHLTAG